MGLAGEGQRKTWGFLNLAVSLGCQLDGVVPLGRSLRASAGRVNWRGQSFRLGVTFPQQPGAPREEPASVHFLLCTPSVQLLLLCCHHTLLPADSGFFCLPSRTEGQQLSRNPPALQRLIGTAKAFCLIGQRPDSQPLQRASALNYLAEARGNLINSLL